MAVRNTRKQAARTLSRRTNPNRDQFLLLMAPDVSRITAEFLWESASFYLEPRLAPHPEDDLVRDLPIDGDDWSMDWPAEFARRRGFDEKDLPAWPEGWPVTLRNYGKWLDMGLSERCH
ncbi:hypothetical protein [Altererythrobacter fulvus]|uniref:hypothetical protein n=1 Tax=Caenibius fulvus TaxID=2126012 RepID=UPI0030190496